MRNYKKKNLEIKKKMLEHVILVSVIGPAYSVSDERSAMTRNYAISLPQHPPGPPSITQPSNATDTAVSALQNPINSPPQILRRQLTATALRHTSAIIPPNYHQLPNTQWPPITQLPQLPIMVGHKSTVKITKFPQLQ